MKAITMRMGIASLTALLLSFAGPVSAKQSPADLLGLVDRGRIAPGRRADLVRVRVVGTTPTVVAVWREGRRIG